MEKATKENLYHYNKRLQPLARNLRNNGTKSEACMWKYILRAGHLKGYKFKRQRPTLNYILDFVCMELMLIIEVDGITHDDELQIIKDKKRDADLAAVGFTTLRFSAWEVLNRINDVSTIILEWIEENHHPNPLEENK